MQERVFTPAQQDVLLSEISDACQHIALLSAHVNDCEGDADLVAALTSCIAVQASRAGWLAEVSRSLADGPLQGVNVVEDAVFWLIPARGLPVRTGAKVEG